MSSIRTKKSGWDEYRDDVKHDKQMAELMRIRGASEAEIYAQENRTQSNYMFAVSVVALFIGFSTLNGGGAFSFICIMVGLFAGLGFIGYHLQVSELKKGPTEEQKQAAAEKERADLKEELRKEMLKEELRKEILAENRKKKAK